MKVLTPTSLTIQKLKKTIPSISASPLTNLQTVQDLLFKQSPFHSYTFFFFFYENHTQPQTPFKKSKSFQLTPIILSFLSFISIPSFKSK